MKSRIQILLFLFLAFTAVIKGQDTLEIKRLQQIKHHLEVIKADSPGLDQTVEMSISGLPLDEFLRALAKNHELNITVGQDLKNPITNNFSNISVADILHFLAKTESLDFQFEGNIIAITKYSPPVVDQGYVPKQLIIVKDSISKDLTVDFKNDSLSLVAKQLTQLTGNNIVYSPKLRGKRISLYVKNEPLSRVLEQMAFANEMQVINHGDSLFHLVVKPKGEAPQKKVKSKKKKSRMTFEINPDGFISFTAENQPLSLIIQELFDEIELDYYYYNELNSNITLNVIEEPLDVFLQKLFNGTNYTFRNKDQVYYFGDRTLEGLRETRRIHLESRSVEKIKSFIPNTLLKDIQIVEFPELNSLIVSGSFPQIEELNQYIETIDKPVPVVQIEVIIIDYNRNHNMETGVEMGIGDQPVSTTGSIGGSGIKRYCWGAEY